MDAGRVAALGAFEMIRGSIPQLECRIDRAPRQVELAMEIPAQAGLLFDVELNLQNEDELHLCASALWVGWFPCTDAEVTRAFVDAVCGLLAGRYRILEHHRGRRVVKAELQRPTAHGWETLTGNSWMGLPWPRKRLLVVQNASFEAAASETGEV